MTIVQHNRITALLTFGYLIVGYMLLLMGYHFAQTEPLILGGITMGIGLIHGFALTMRLRQVWNTSLLQS